MTREEAAKYIKSRCIGSASERDGTKWSDAMWTAIEALSADMPTGEWRIREYDFFTCSECGDDYWNGCDCTEEAEERLRNGDYPKFCPNCGAKMDVNDE